MAVVGVQWMVKQQFHQLLPRPDFPGTPRCEYKEGKGPKNALVPAPTLDLYWGAGGP